MTKVIDFQTTPSGNDTGEASTEAIAPLKNGEPADQAVLARPDEVLRGRTEVLRVEANEAKWLRDNDRALFAMLSTGGSIAWGGTAANGGSGELVLSAGASLILVPGTTPGAARGDANEGVGTRFPTRYATATIGTVSTNDFTVQADVFDFEGSFNISVQTVDDPGSGDPPTVAVSGTSVANEAVQPGVRDIVVTYDSVFGHTAQDIVDAINGNATAAALVTATLGTDGAMAEFGPVTLAGGGDGLFHEITNTQLAGFFAADPDNDLLEGDTLAIWYSTVQNRRESVEENASEHLIPAASLVNLSAEPEKAADSVIIGRVVDDAFVLFNGVALRKSVSVSSVQAVGDTDLELLRADYERGIAAPPANGGGEGSTRLGIDASGFSTISSALESQQAFNDAVDTAIGADALNLKTHVHNDGAGDAEAPKVHLGDHIDYGANGELRVTTDAAGDHIITHSHLSGGDAEFQSAKLRASLSLVAPVIDNPTAVFTNLIRERAAGVPIDIRDSAGAVGGSGSLTAANTAKAYCQLSTSGGFVPDAPIFNVDPASHAAVSAGIAIVNLGTGPTDTATKPIVQVTSSGSVPRITGGTISWSGTDWDVEVRVYDHTGSFIDAIVNVAVFWVD